jgi:hypothetical protein
MQAHIQQKTTLPDTPAMNVVMDLMTANKVAQDIKIAIELINEENININNYKYNINVLGYLNILFLSKAGFNPVAKF